MNRFVQLCLVATFFASCVADGIQPVYQPAAVNPTLAYLQSDPNNNYPADQPVYTAESRVPYSPYASIQTPTGSQASANAPADSYPVESYPAEGYQTYQGYEPGYGVQTGYEGYLVPSAYNQLATTDDIGPLSYFYGILPYAATAIKFAGKAAVIVITGAGILLAGALVTLGFCSFTPFCTISFRGLNPTILREEVRSLITPDRLSAATKFVRDAISKYEDLQKSTAGRRRR